MGTTRRISVLLSSLFMAASAISIAACSGGGSGSGADPCCSATGPLEQPAAFAPGDRFARAVLLSTSAAFCPTLESLDLSPLSNLTPAGAEVALATGATSYSVEIDATATGQDVGVLIYEKDVADKPVPLGIASLAEAAAVGATPIQVSPLRLRGTRLGESTIEAGAACLLGASLSPAQLLNFTVADVRAVVTSEMAVAFTPGLGDKARVTAQIVNYAQSIDAFTALSPSNRGEFKALRRQAEARVDRCRNGAEVLPGCSAGGARSAEFYRYWSYPRSSLSSFSGTLTFRDELQVWAQFAAEREGFGVALPAEAAFKLSSLRQNHMFRYETVVSTLTEAFSGFGGLVGLDTPAGGAPSINTSFATLRQAILDATSPSDFDLAWRSFGLNVVRVFEVLSGIDASGSAFPMTQVYNGAFGTQAAANTQATITSGFTFLEVALALFEDPGAADGEYEALLRDINMNPATSAYPLAERQVIAAVMFYLSANTAPIAD